MSLLSGKGGQGNVVQWGDTRSSTRKTHLPGHCPNVSQVWGVSGKSSSEEMIEERMKRDQKMGDYQGGEKLTKP